MLLPIVSKLFLSARPRLSAFTICLLAIFGALCAPRAFATNTPSTTVLTVSPASPQAGGTAQTITATVTATSGGASVTPGVVNFYDLTSVAAAGTSGSYTARPLLIGTAQLKSNGTASIKVILGASATHNLTAKFLRNTTYAASASSSVADVITAGQYDPITITTTGNANYNNGSSPRNTYNMDVLFTYHGYAAPTGTMSFSNTATSAVLGTTTNLVRGNGAPFNEFTQQSTPAVTAGTNAIAKGDFNGDGKLDIVVTNTSAATVSVYLGNGDGTFGAETTYAVGSAASNGLAGIAVGDFNNDGKLDIAVPNSTTGNVSILLGNGDGTFGSHVEYTTPTNPNRIVVGDFNEDGNLDLMVAGGSGSSYSVSLLLGNGSGGFSTSTSLTTTPWATNSAGATDMVAADFNGDGHLDLLTDCYSCENFSLFKGNGDGTFQTVVSGYPPVMQDPWGLAVADFNGDGIPDIAFAAGSANRVNYALGDGTGAFSHSNGVAYSGAVSWIAVGDANGDGWPDLIATVYASGSTGVALNNPGSATSTAAGFAAPLTASTSTHPYQVVAGDFHGTGLGDFAVATASNVNLFQYGLGNEAAVGSTYYGETGIVLTSTTSLSPNNFNATYLPASSDLYGTSVSNIVQLPVYGVTTPTLSVGQSSYNYGQSPVLTVNVPSISGTVPTGTADIYTYYGYGLVGSVTLASGSATYTLSVPNAGSYGVTPLYEGDANYISTSSPVNTQFTVIPETPTLSVTSSPSSQIVGGNVTLSATVGVTANAHAGIVVNLHLGGSGASCTTNSSGQCSATIVMPSTGAQAVSASVVATQNLTTASATGSTSPTGYQITSTPVLTASPNPSFPSQTVTLTATLPVVSGFTPTGSVNFNEGGNTLGTANVNGSGVATFTTSGLALGSHSILAAYSGDSTFFAANSSTLTQVVAAASFAISLSAPATVTQGSATTLSATVTANGSPLYPALVQFYDASSSPQLLGTVSTNSSGVATLPRVLSPGAHTVHAVFTGQAAGSPFVSSSNGTATVTGNGTLATATGLNLLGSPGSYTLSAPVSLSGGSAPTGSVTFQDATNGNATIGTGSVGSFVRSVATPVQYAVGSNPPGVFPFAAATGDLNGDGILDLVVANYTDGGGNGQASITVLLGVGDGTFTANNTFQAFDPTSLTLVDVDQDGILDLLVTRDGNNDMQVYHGVGDGTFTQLGYGVNGGLFPINVGVADFDKDGLPDIVITSNSGGARFVHGNGDGTFGQYGNGTNFSTGNRSIGITVGDYNGDGNPDFIVTNAADGTVGVFLGDGTGNFATQVTYAVGNYPNSIVTGDFNGDGKQDIAVTNQSDHTIGILLGNGDGTFQTMVTYNAGSNGPGNISIADMNGDGKDDLIVTNTVTINGSGLGISDQNNGGNFYDDSDSDNTVGIFTSNGDGTFQAMTTVSTGAGTIPYATVIGDFNGDGLPDFAVPNSATDNVGVFLGKRAGVATLTGSAVNNAGPVQVRARYTPGTSDAYAASTSSNVQLQASSIPTLTSSANPSPNGSSLTITATVPTLGGVVPTGTIHFFDGGTSLGTQTLASGSATYSTSSLSTATHTITAMYSGNSFYVSTTSAALSQVITIPTTSVTLATSQTPRVYGSSVTFTATLGSSSATGTVTFKDGANVLGTGTLTAGVASFATSALTAGSHSITAVYGGDSNFSGNTSATLTQVVTQSTAATTTLTTSGTPAAFGTSVTFTATLGNLAATGTVQFMDGATSLGVQTVSAGVATYTSSSLSVSTHSITAQYSGDINFASTAAASLSQVITQATPVLAAPTVSPTSASYGTSVTLTQTLPQGATGTVTFYSGSTSLGTATISGGVATLTTSALPGGSNSLTTAFGGNTNYTSATSSAAVLTVAAATLVLAAPSASPTSATYGTSVTLAQAVPSGVTGTITFYAGSTVLGTGTVASGVATLTTTAIPAGTNALTTSFGGNANYTAATSAAGSIAIALATTSLGALTITPSSAVYGTSVTITQAVPAGLTGTMNFYNTPNFIGSGTISGGVATFTTTTLPVGTDVIRTIYVGDANHNSSQAGPVNAIITAATSTAATLSTSTTSASYGTSVTLTSMVTVSSNPLTSGTVTFLSGGTSIGTASLNGSGVATLALTTLPVGSNVLTASIAASTNYIANVSTPVTVTITQVTPTLAAPTLSPTTATFGSSVTITQTVPTGLTGTLSFYSGSTLLGTGTISGNVATLITSSIPAGASSITTNFAGNTNYAPATSAAGTITITQATPTLAAPTASPTSAVYGTPVTLTQTVPAGATGTISFYSGSTLLGTGAISGTTATLTTTALTLGSNSITASFPGNANYSAATSAAGTIAITAQPTTTALIANPSGGTYGTSITLTATVTVGGSPVTSGTVQFLLSGVSQGTGTLNSSGVATFTSTTLPVGLDLFTATFAAAGNYAASTSTVYSVNINKATPILSAPTMSPTGASYGTPITITQTIPSGVAGTVTFYNGSTLLGTATIAGGVATLTTSALPVGSNTINVQYAGNANYNAVSSPTASIAIVQGTATLTGLSATPTTAAYGSQVIFNLNVSSGTSAFVTGQVTFFNGSTSIGVSSVSSNSASLVTSTLPLGANSITASYAATTNFAAATSSAITVTITPATPTIGAPTFSPASPTYGTSITLTQAVPTGVTGTLTFYNGSTSLGTATISGGIATLTTSALPGGANSITTSFPGNSNYTAATSAAATINVTAATIQLPALSVTPSAPTFGTPVTFSQTVPNGVTGTITFYNSTNGTQLGTATIANGVATLTTTSLLVGNNNIVAVFPASANYATANSGNTTVVVSTDPTVTSLTASPSSAGYGTAIALSATVTASGSPLTSGSVTFLLSSSGSILLGSAALNSSGVATLSTTNLPLGSNVITASIAATTTLSASSSTFTVTITQATPTLAAPSASPTTAAYGTAVTLTQQVPSGLTGAISFYSGSTLLGTATINGGVAALTTTTLPVGANAITASFAGNTNYAAAVSAAATVSISQVAATLSTPTFSPASPAYGQTVTLIQAVPTGVTGTITFLNNGVSIGTGTVSGGVASLTTTTLPVGANAITASFAGNTNYAAAVSAAATVNISQATPALAAPSASPTTAVYGSSITLTQAVPTGVTGTITFYSGTASLGTAPISGGVATLVTSALPAGTNAVTSSFGGNANFTSATSAATTVTISGGVTSTSLTGTPSSAPYGTSIALTSTVTSSGTPLTSGIVQFMLGSVSLGTAAVNGGGIANLTIATLPAGVNLITASYAINGSYSASTSSPFSVTITQATASLTAPSSSPTSAAFGTSVTLTQTVPAGVTGTIAFYNGSTVLGTATIASGVATLTTAALPAGSNSITASFPGNANFAAATSAPTTITITQASATLAAPTFSPTSAVFGTSVTLTQTVPAGVTGTITFYNGSTILGTATIVNGVATLTTAALPAGSNSITASFPGNANFAAATSAPTAITVTQAAATLATPTSSPTSAAFGTSVTLTQTVPAGVTGTITFYNGSTVLGTATIANGVATLTTAALPAGSNSITASFPGNANFAAAVSAPATITITPLATSTTLNASAATGHPGDSITLSATVSTASSPVAAGTVNFLLGSTSLGTANLNSSGIATLTITSLPIGADSITAAFTGTANLATSTSTAVTVTIATATPPGYSISANPPSLTIHAGSSASTVLTITPVGGFTGTLTLACNQLPANATCEFMQNGVANSTVILNGTNQPVQLGLTVRTSMAIASQDAHPLPRSGPAFALMLPCGLLALLAIGSRRKTLPRLLALCLLLLAGGSALSGCAGGGFGTNSTPIGTSVATVTATATASGTGAVMPAQSFNLTITIIQ